MQYLNHGIKMNRVTAILLMCASIYLASCSAGKLAMKKGDKKLKYGEFEYSIDYFEKAIEVQKATELYHQKTGMYPKSLAKLVPGFIDRLPQFERGFSLAWEPPVLRLVRPLKKK